MRTFDKYYEPSTSFFKILFKFNILRLYFQLHENVDTKKRRILILYKQLDTVGFVKFFRKNIAPFGVCDNKFKILKEINL